jgi:hypothetical protein
MVQQNMLAEGTDTSIHQHTHQRKEQTMPTDTQNSKTLPDQPRNQVLTRQENEAKRPTLQSTPRMRQQVAEHMADHTAKRRPNTDTQNLQTLQQPEQKTGQASKRTTTRKKKQNQQQPSAIKPTPPVLPQDREPGGNKIHKRGNGTTQQWTAIQHRETDRKRPGRADNGNRTSHKKTGRQNTGTIQNPGS